MEHCLVSVIVRNCDVELCTWALSYLSGFVRKISSSQIDTLWCCWAIDTIFDLLYPTFPTVAVGKYFVSIYLEVYVYEMPSDQGTLNKRWSCSVFRSQVSFFKTQPAQAPLDRCLGCWLFPSFFFLNSREARGQFILNKNSVTQQIGLISLLIYCTMTIMLQIKVRGVLLPSTLNYLFCYCSPHLFFNFYPSFLCISHTRHWRCEDYSWHLNTAIGPRYAQRTGKG